MSAPLSHNELVLNRRLADLTALSPGHAAGWVNTIDHLKAIPGLWTPETIASVLGGLVETLIAVEDLREAEVL